MNIDDEIDLKESLIVIKQRAIDNEMTGYRQQGIGPADVSADLNADGTRIIEATGKPYPGKGNQAEIRVAEIFVKFLNQIPGNTWADPEKLDQENDPVDLISRDTTRHTLKMQITRALPERRIREELSRGAVSRSYTEDDLFDQIRLAIASKRFDRKASKDIVLLLDAATETILAAPSDLATSFRNKHSSEVQNIFKEIWLVGPAPSFVFRIDA